jgi:biotin synthase-like enzyme
MQIINRRKRKGERRGVVILVDPEALAGGQAHSYRYKEDAIKRKGLRRISNVNCDAGCGYCIFGYKSNKDDPGTGCLLKDSKVKVAAKKMKKT